MNFVQILEALIRLVLGQVRLDNLFSQLFGHYFGNPAHPRP